MFIIILIMILLWFKGMSSYMDMLLLFVTLELVFYMILYTLSWFHIMMLLMILELFMLNIFLFGTMVMPMLGLPSFLVFFFITLSVAEASIGISLLTMLIRAHGNDFILMD